MKHTIDNPKLIDFISSFQDTTFTCVVKTLKNTIVYFLNGEYHREDGPAFIYDNGDICWYLNGKLHRTDGPAVECHGNKEWWLNGKLHREDGPAIEYVDCGKLWYLNGQRHREDGPAVEYANGIVTGKQIGRAHV